MARSLNIQAFGAVLVLVSFICAESAAWYLIACPSSSLAWYLNLGPFHIFETARGSASALRYLFTPNSLLVAVAVLLVVLLAWLFHIRLLVALAANLSFAFVAALVDSALRMRPTSSVEFLPSTVALFLNPDFAAVLIILLIASLTSCVASHISFIAAILSETPNNRNQPRQVAAMAYGFVPALLPNKHTGN